MKTKQFFVEILKKVDSTKEAWLTSKPTITYDNQAELESTVKKMITQDLPLSAFETYHLKFTSSLLFRDLLFTVRPCIAWSSSFRINPITPDRIAIEDNDFDDLDLQLMDSHMNPVYERFTSGESLDKLKLSLYLGTITQYVVVIDSRTLMCFIATLHEMDADGFATIIKTLCEVMGFDNYDQLPKTSAKSLYSKLKVGDDTDYSALTPNKDYPISDYVEQESPFNIAFLDVIVNASTGGQFLRQHFSTVRNQMYDIVKKIGYKKSLMMTCSDRFRYQSFGDILNFRQLVSRRCCWVCNFDWEYETSGVESWSDILRPMINQMSLHDFAKSLPCKLSWKNCSVSEETRLRLWKEKGQTGVAPDQNVCCPILVGDKSMVEVRGKFYKSNSVIFDMWKELAAAGWIKEDPTKWSEERES